MPLASRPLFYPSRLTEEGTLTDEGTLGYLLRLAEKNQVSVSEILKVLLSLAATNVDEPRKALSLDQAQRRLTEPCRFCPRCLRSRDTWHHAWEIPCADACAVCGAWLVDECSACLRPLSWKRPCLKACSCGHQLSQEVERDAPVALHQLAASLAALDRGKPAGLTPLQGMGCEQAVEVVWFLGQLAVGSARAGHRWVPSVRTIRDNWPISTAAAEVLADWPQGLCQILDARRLAIPNHDRGSLLRTFSVVYGALYRHPRNVHFEFIRDAFEAYVLERWPGQIAKRHRRLEDRLVGDSVWIRISQASRLTRYTVNALRTLAESGELESQTWTTKRGRTFLLLRRESVDALLEKNGAAVDLLEAASRLGLPDSRLAQIVQRLCPDASKPIAPGARWLIPSSWVERWERFMASQPYGIQGSNTSFPLIDCLRYLIPDSDALAILLLDIEAHRLPVLGRWPNLHGLSGIALERAAFQQWMQQHRICLQTFSLRTAAKRLGVKEEVAYFLARSELLKTTAVRLGRRTERHLNEAALDEFSSQYVFAQTIAHKLGSSAKAVRRFLDDAGVAPVAGPGVDDCRQLVYQRGPAEKALRSHGLDLTK